MKKILLGFLLGIPVLGFSQSFQVNLQGQKQTAMGGAGTGLALDEAAVFFNPGAVSFLKQNGAQAGAHGIFLKTAFNETGSTLTEYNKNKVPTPAAAYAVFGSPEGRLRFGIGAYTPFGGAMHWNEDWTGKYTVTSLDLRAIYIQPTLSLKITDNIGLGAGLVYALGHVDLRRALPYSSNGQQTLAQLKGNSKDFGWNAGLFIKTASGISIGLSHRSQVTAKVENGDANFFNAPSAIQPVLPTKFSASLPLPATSTIGFGFYPSDKTTIALDVNWVWWHTYKELGFDYNNNYVAAASPRNYHDAATFRVGIQHETTTFLTLRAGVGYALSPVGEGYVTPEVPDADRLLLSAGIGLKPSARFGIDFSFLYENLKSRTETNHETNLSGTFKTLAYIPGVALSYKF